MSGRRAATAASAPVMVWDPWRRIRSRRGQPGQSTAAPIWRPAMSWSSTINYRMGAFGFIDLHGCNQRPRSGNGHGRTCRSDSRAQLGEAEHRGIRWRSGQCHHLRRRSAGGLSIGALLAEPVCARGLFLQGNSRNRAQRRYRLRPRARGARRVARVPWPLWASSVADSARLARHAFRHNPEGAGRAACEKRATRPDLPRKLRDAFPFQPTIDGTLLPSRARSKRCARRPRQNGIPLLTGTTREEWKLFTAAQPRLRLMSPKGLSERMTRLASTNRLPAMLDTRTTEGSPFERFNAIMTDKTFTVPAGASRRGAGRACAGLHLPLRLALAAAWRDHGLVPCARARALCSGTHNQELREIPSSAPAPPLKRCRTHHDGLLDGVRAANGQPIDEQVRTCPATATTGAWPRYDEARDMVIFGDGAPRPVRAGAQCGAAARVGRLSRNARSGREQQRR